MPRWAPAGPGPDALGVQPIDRSPLAAPSMSNAKPTVYVNGIDYRWPLRPVVVVCIDGGDPAYLRQFLADGSIPNIARFVREGYAAVADGSMPSFTCPNNMSIITGTPTAQARHLGQLLPRHRHLAAGGHDRPGAAARRHHHRQVRRGRRQGGDHHRQGQAAQAAGPRAWTSPRVTSPFPANTLASARWPRTAFRTCCRGWAWNSRACIRWS